MNSMKTILHCVCVCVCVCVYIYVIYIYVYNLYIYMHTLFIHLSVHAFLGSFHLLAIVNDSALIMGIQVSI